MNSSEQEFLRLVADTEARDKSARRSNARDEFAAAKLELEMLQRKQLRLEFLRSIPELLYLGSVCFVLASIFPKQWGLIVIVLGIAVTIYLQVGYLGWLEKERALSDQIEEMTQSLAKLAEAAGIETLINRSPLKPKNSFTILGIRLKYRCANTPKVGGGTPRTRGDPPSQQN